MNRAARQPRLVGVPYHGGIEQRGGYQRVFLREIGPDQELPGFGQLFVRDKVLLDLLEAFKEELHRLAVPAAEFAPQGTRAGPPLPLRAAS